MQSNFKYDPLAEFREEIRSLIKKKHRTVEEFCWEKKISKSVISKLLSGKQLEFHLETLVRIGSALGKKISVKVE